MNGAVVVAGITVGTAIVFSSVFLLLRILAWVVTRGLPSMLRLRGRAVVEWQDDPKDSSEERSAEDEAIAVAAASNDDHFALWEAEFGERAA